MKAIIMAGGEGSRLRPITCKMPKPAVPICDKPVILHIIELLAKHGINDIAITLKHLPGEIKKIVNNYLSTTNSHLNISFCTETVPLGTAGGVKNCINKCFASSDEDYFIISGDAFTDIDVSEMINFHKEKGKIATIAVKSVELPTEFGVVLTNKNSMITGFIEKPQWSEAVSNVVNTGIYIVTPEITKLCPDDTFCDFAKDIFPKINDLSNSIAAYHTDAYWCDIGNPSSYKKVNMDYLSNKKDSFIGENCTVSSKADIKNCVIGHNSTIEADCVLTNCIIMSNAIIEKGSILSDSIICRNVKIEEGVIAEDSIIGENSEIGKSSYLKKGSKIWDNSNIIPESIISGVVREFDGSVGSYSPETILRLGKAFGTFLGRNASVLVCSDDYGSSCMIAAGFKAALAGTGAEIKTIEMIPLSIARWICRTGICDGAVYISKKQKSHIYFLNGYGDDLCKNERRKLKTIYDMEDFASVNPKNIPSFDELSNPEDYYISSLLNIFKCPHKTLNFLSHHFTRGQRFAISTYLTIKMYPDAPIFIPACDSLAAEKIARKYDRYVIKCGNKNGDIMAEMENFMHIEGVYAQYLMLFDDLAFDFAICCLDGYMTNELDNDAQSWINTPLYNKELEIPCPNANKAEIMKKFLDSKVAISGYEIHDGICIHKDNISAKISADEDKQAFHIYVESVSEELGKDIAGEILKTIENLLT